MPISNNEQQTAGDNGCHVSSLYWDALFFPLWLCLQNRRGLDLLTAEEGGLCLFLGEDYCFFTNKSGIVKDSVRKMIFSIKVYVTLLDYLKFLRLPS
jgi:hypothetical protein